jgi:hypothetical protein
MPRSEERGGMAARSEAEANSLLVYKSPARKGGVIYCLLGSPGWFANKKAVDPSYALLAHLVAVLRHVVQVADPGIFGFPKPWHLYFASSVFSLIFTATSHIVGPKTLLLSNLHSVPLNRLVRTQ